MMAYKLMSMNKKLSSRTAKMKLELYQGIIGDDYRTFDLVELKGTSTCNNFLKKIKRRYGVK